MPGDQPIVGRDDDEVPPVSGADPVEGWPAEVPRAASDDHDARAPGLGPVPLERVAPPERRGRAGRDLVAAFSVGFALAGLILASLRINEVLFVAVVAVAVVLAVLELANALATAGIRVPLVPTLVGSSTLPIATYAGGPEALLLAVAATVIGVVAWCVARRTTTAHRHGNASSEPDDGGGRDLGVTADVTAAIFAVLYVAFLACFAVLMVRADDGVARVVTFVLLVALSDTGGYAVGVLFGRHPMAPAISPNKSWEGFAGSAALSAAGGALIVSYLTWGSALQGAVIGFAVMLAATLGDLGESMIKRDIGVKDMGSLLPGHGGLMDRLDSLLPAAPVAYLLLSWVAPA